MYSVIETEYFTQWVDGLRDMPTRIRLRRRLRRVMLGIWGDVKPVGDDVWEMREFFGPGWRMYYVRHGATIIVMLGGGDKSSQSADIQRAKRIAQEILHEFTENQNPPV